MNFRKLLRSKIHRATITHADLNYEGSITLPPELLKEANMLPFEAVNIWNVTNGNRFETYTIEGKPGSTDVAINGAAARLVSPGDVIIIAAFGFFQDEAAQTHTPTVVFVDENNRSKGHRKEIPGPQLVKC